MKNLLQIIFLILFSISLSAFDTSSMTKLSSDDLQRVKVDFNYAIYKQKQAYRYKNYQDYDRNFRPSISVINQTSRDFTSTKHNVGGWHPARGESMVSKSSLVHRVYDQHQINYLMGGDFAVFVFEKNGKTIYLLKDKQ